MGMSNDPTDAGFQMFLVGKLRTGGVKLLYGQELQTPVHLPEEDYNRLSKRSDQTSAPFLPRLRVCAAGFGSRSTCPVLRSEEEGNARISFHEGR